MTRGPKPTHQRGHPKSGTGAESQLIARIERAMDRKLDERLPDHKSGADWLREIGEGDGPYTRHSPYNFLEDAVVLRTAEPATDAWRDAQARMNRYNALTKPQQRDQTVSSLKGTVPPRYMRNLAETAARKRRVVADVIDRREIEASEMGNKSVLPEITTGSTAATPANELATGSETDAVVADNEQAWTTIRGVAEMSFATLDRSEGTVVWDLLLADLAASISEQIETQLFGDGTSGTLGGLLKTGLIPTANAKTANANSPTAAMMHKRIVDIGTVVSGSRDVAPDHVALHPRRRNAMLKAYNADGLPLFGDGLPFIGDMRVLSAPAVPSTLGTADDQDIAIGFVADDLVLIESPLMVEAGVDPHIHNWTHTVQVARYVALHVRHGGKGVSSVGGTVFAAGSAGLET